MTGDVFEKLGKNEQGWELGRKDGNVGLYPANYVELIEKSQHLKESSKDNIHSKTAVTKGKWNVPPRNFKEIIDCL